MGEGLGVSIRHRAATAVAAAFVLGTGLTACEDGSAEPPDSGLPSESETSASSPTPTEPSETGPTPPELPDAADETGPKAAEAFVRHYVELINYAKHTLDVEPWQAASGEQCTDCMTAIQTIVDLGRSGARIEGGTGRVTGIDQIPGQPLNEPILDVTVHWTKERIVKSAGQQPQVNDAVTCLHTWNLSRASEGWILSRWRTVSCHV